MISPIYSSQRTLDFTYTITQRILNIDGDLIECGIAGGSQIAMMQKCLIDNNVRKSIYGYDSFEGIPHGTNDDVYQPGLHLVDKTRLGVLESTGVSSHSEQNVKDNFASWDMPIQNVYLVKGWFQNTMPLAKHDKIALLRLDGDLYESTKVCMQYLYNKVSVGGIILIDDWNLHGCRKAILEFVNIGDVILSEDVAYIVKK